MKKETKNKKAGDKKIPSDALTYMPFYAKNETIHKDGQTQVKLWLTREQSQSLFVFHDAIGIPYHVLVQIAVSEYVDSHLNEAEKKQVADCLRPSIDRYPNLSKEIKKPKA